MFYKEIKLIHFFSLSLAMSSFPSLSSEISLIPKSVKCSNLITFTQEGELLKKSNNLLNQLTAIALHLKSSPSKECHQSGRPLWDKEDPCYVIEGTNPVEYESTTINFFNEISDNWYACNFQLGFNSMQYTIKGESETKKGYFGYFLVPVLINTYLITLRYQPCFITPCQEKAPLPQTMLEQTGHSAFKTINLSEFVNAARFHIVNVRIKQIDSQKNYHAIFLPIVNSLPFIGVGCLALYGAYKLLKK